MIVRSREARTGRRRSVFGAVLVGLLLELSPLATPLAPVATEVAHAAVLPTPSFTELHGFRSAEGSNPNAVLIQASDGNFYGTTQNGGDDGNGCKDGCAGTVFKLTPTGQYTMLHTFAHDNPQGAYVNGEKPTSGVVEGPDGFLYGTTSMGGFSGQGIVYKISKSGQFIKIHDFCTVPRCTDGNNDGFPMASPTVGMDGMLYGVTPGAGDRLGQVFWRMGLDGSNVTPLFHVTGASAGLFNDVPSLFQASDGNFYFTAGSGCCSGVIMQMTPSGLMTNFHTFGGFAGDRLTQARDGLIYGVGKACCTSVGGEVWSTSVNGAFNVVLNLSAATTGGGQDAPVQTPDGNLRMITTAGLLTIDTSGNVLQVVPVPTQVGNDPNSQLLVGKDGKLYGTSFTGGVHDDGTPASGTVYVIDINPPTAPIVVLPSPQRVFDSRIGSGGPITVGHDRCVAMGGLFGIPLDATGVIVNATAVGQTDIGWFTLYPRGQSVPATSTLDYDPHEYAIANGSIVRLGSGANGTGGQICIDAGRSAAHAVIDVTGYLTAAAPTSMPLLPNPARVVDTRLGIGGPGGFIVPGADRCFSMAGVSGIPADATGVLVNVTATGYLFGSGWVTVYPGGQGLPATSTLNFDTREFAIANNALIRLGSGQLCVNAGQNQTQVILDVVGFVTSAGLAQVPLIAPVRVVDTRIALGGPGGMLAPGTDRCFTVAGVAGIPATAAGVIVNGTAVSHTAIGWLTLYPGSTTLPSTSTLNFDPNEYAIANGAVLAVNNHQICVDVGLSPANAILDVTGYIPGG